MERRLKKERNDNKREKTGIERINRGGHKEKEKREKTEVTGWR